MNTARLTRIHVAGFRSLRDVTLELTPVTLLIGPNGAGKSNLLGVLEMVRLLAHEALQLFVSERGGATYLLHYGPQVTAAVDIDIGFASDAGEHRYSARLGFGANESLTFLQEMAGIRAGTEDDWHWSDMGAGHLESKLRERAEKDAAAKTVLGLLRQINFYHFHDTSRRSALRTRDFADGGSDYLRSNGSNLAAFLDGLRNAEDEESKASWRRFLFHVTSVAPFIRDITPSRDRHGFALYWVDDRGATFGPAHLSDGTLRAMALFATLLQPPEGLPLLSCFDEPELGLHPAAVELLASAMRGVATERQILVSTQSTELMDQFEPEDVVVCERKDGGTCVRRLSTEGLKEWLSDYRLSEIYASNLFGGRP